MMFISCLALCCTTILTPTDDWSDRDETAFTTARSRCGEIYKDSPCLVKFTKMEEADTYRAICGANNSK